MSRYNQRAIIAERKKLVQKLEAELERIWTAKLTPQYIILPKPIRDGWFKTLRLRDDIKRSRKAKTYQEVLDAVVVDVWGSEKKYADKNWITYFNRNRKEYPRPGIRRLDEKEHSKLSSKARKCFIKRATNSLHRFRYACTIPRYYFISTYKRAYIDKFKIPQSKLESRYQEIMEILENPVLRSHSTFYNYHHRFCFNPTKRERRKIKMELGESRKAYAHKLD